jgi:hypothetical protein
MRAIDFSFRWRLGHTAPRQASLERMIFVILARSAFEFGVAAATRPFCDGIDRGALRRCRETGAAGARCRVGTLESPYRGMSKRTPM